MVVRVTTSKIAAAACKVLSRRRGRSVSVIVESDKILVPRQMSIINLQRRNANRVAPRIFAATTNGTFHYTDKKQVMDFHHQSTASPHFYGGVVQSTRASAMNVAVDPFLSNLLDGFCIGRCDHQRHHYHYHRRTSTYSRISAQQREQQRSAATSGSTGNNDDPTQAAPATRAVNTTTSTTSIMGNGQPSQQQQQRSLHDHVSSSSSLSLYDEEAKVEHAKNVAHMIMMRKELLLLHQLLDTLYGTDGSRRT